MLLDLVLLLLLLLLLLRYDTSTLEICRWRSVLQFSFENQIDGPRVSHDGYTRLHCTERKKEGTLLIAVGRDQIVVLCAGKRPKRPNYTQLK